jgi:hypothetical protein
MTVWACTQCHTAIGRGSVHVLLGPRQMTLVCIRCANDPGIHRRIYPDCPHPWHDLHDHPVRFASRAAAEQHLHPKENTA